MTEGAKWELTVPYELGSPATPTSTTMDDGDDNDPISIGAVLIFTLELLKVMNDSHDEL